MADFEPPRAPRVATSIVATVSAGKRTNIRFKILNLSASGAKLEGPLSLNVKDRIEIRFEAEGERVDLAAEVVRVATPDLFTDQIAARFVDVGPEARAVLQRLVAQLLDAGGGEEEPDEDDDAEIVVEPE